MPVAPKTMILVFASELCMVTDPARPVQGIRICKEKQDTCEHKHIIKAYVNIVRVLIPSEISKGCKILSTAAVDVIFRTFSQLELVSDSDAGCHGLCNRRVTD